MGVFLVLFIVAGSRLKPDNEAAITRTSELHSERLKLLKERDYVSYQTTLLSSANAAIQKKNYKEAQNMLNDIIKNVPTQEIKPDVYLLLSKLAKIKGDDKNYDKYTSLLVSKLKQQNQNVAADYYAKEAKSSQ
ncbi:MAG: hypothetical protein QFB86_04195 [Patescibacteria group bacterium]|nr:hypothetical protein [Patescibacteria group bacterium]